MTVIVLAVVGWGVTLYVRSQLRAARARTERLRAQGWTIL